MFTLSIHVLQNCVVILHILQDSVFRCLHLFFTTNMTRDDLEMKQDYYDYYMQVPILHYAYVRNAQDENDLAEVKKQPKTASFRIA